MPPQTDALCVSRWRRACSFFTSFSLELDADVMSGQSRADAHMRSSGGRSEPPPKNDDDNASVRIAADTTNMEKNSKVHTACALPRGRLY